MVCVRKKLSTEQKYEINKLLIILKNRNSDCPDTILNEQSSYTVRNFTIGPRRILGILSTQKSRKSMKLIIYF